MVKKGRIKSQPITKAISNAGKSANNKENE